MEPSPSGKNTIENSITMNKMKLLKEKMESMNLDRKPKRAPKVQPRPPNTHPASGSGGVTPRPPLLPALTPLSSGTSGHLWLGSSQPQGTQHSMGNLATEDLHDPVLSILPHKEHKPKAVLCPVEAEGNVVRTGGGAGTQGTRRTSASSLSSSPASSGAAVHSSGNHGAPGKPHRQPRAWNSKADPEPAIPSPSCGCRGVKVRFQGKRPEIFSRVEAMTDKASKEPLGHVSNSGLVASLARSSSRAGVKSAHGQSQLHPLGPTQRPPHPHLQLETPGGSAWAQPAVPFPSALGLGMNRNIAAAGKRGGECTHYLPPVKAPLQTKKKTRKHCFLCGKKTGLATTYECRCGNNFCSSHRYAETHGCTYDYKSAGRRFLQEANPVVKAPKLPKI